MHQEHIYGTVWYFEWMIWCDSEVQSQQVAADGFDEGLAWESYKSGC